MRTNVEINDKLIEEAIGLSKVKTKKEVIDIALKNYVNQMKRKSMAELFGKVKWEGDLNEMRTVSE